MNSLKQTFPVKILSLLSKDSNKSNILEHNYDLIELENIFIKEPVKKPLVSIIIPAHNAEKTIGNCLFSIIKQSIVDNVFIVINNNSTDNTTPLATTFADQDFRIKIINQENQKQGTYSVEEAIKHINTNKVLVIKPEHILDKEDIENLIRDKKIKEIPHINYYSKRELMLIKIKSFFKKDRKTF